MTRFDCLRCGKCCISFIDRFYYIPTGLALTPTEVKLFDQADVRPFLGVQTTTGIIPVWYQLISAPCPHYDHDRYRCRIYERRPLVCQAYPFKVVLNYTLLGRCAWLMLQTKKNAVELPAEIVQANETIAAYDHATLGLAKHEQVRIFNFETGAWLALQDN
jgi:Fe-S-cluster containining protein